MNPSVQSLLVLGTRTFAIEVADLIEQTPRFEMAGFVENMDSDRCQQQLDGKPVIWVQALAELNKTHQAICGLATTHRHRFTDQVDALGMKFATLVHPFAHVSATSSLSEGCIASVGTIVASHTRLGRHVILNRAALVGHHTEISDTD